MPSETGFGRCVDTAGTLTDSLDVSIAAEIDILLNLCAEGPWS
jgi:hypothetical protein